MVCGAISVVQRQAAILNHMSERPTVDESEGDVRQKRMLELTIYGLMGLAAILVVAFYYAYDD
jgi:hypothetical protein